MVARNFGYTLLELVITLGIIGVVAVIIFFGIGSFNKNQSLVNAQQEFVSNLRSAQNRVLTGADAATIMAVSFPVPSGSPPVISSYSVANAASNTTTAVNLPTGVSMTLSLVEADQTRTAVTGALTVCFVNRNLATYDGSAYNGFYAHECGSCATGNGFACQDGIIVLQKAVEAVFSQGSAQNKVEIEGTGMYIDRVYGQ